MVKQNSSLKKNHCNVNLFNVTLRFKKFKFRVKLTSKV